MKNKSTKIIGTLCALGIPALGALAANTAGMQSDTTLSAGLNEVVITGVTSEASKLKSSVSITTLKPSSIEQSTPRTTAEIFRSIPGIRSESSGGEGNTNIAVRGVPISAGGSKYLQLQEDGLPVFLFGDMAFATSDIFLRFDQSVDRIEAIRGGSASTMASNSPAGIINFISKTGSKEGGSISSTFGLDYDQFRTDFDFGTPLTKDVSFHVGGFFRNGEGPRKTGFNANNGGQIKANMTKRFDNGYARVYFKHLNDRTAAYMPQPMQVTGTNANPVWEGIGDFSANQDALHSVFLSSNYGIGSNGERRIVDVADGMHPKSTAVGTEFVYNLENGWRAESRTRWARNSGRFVAPFTAAAGTTANMLSTVGSAVGRDLTGATLTRASDGSAFTGELAQVVHMFDTELENFNTMVSDNNLSKTFGNLKVKLGYYRALQDVNMSWLWNSYLTEIKGGGQASPLDITMADGTQISESGQFAYGVPVWGNCCQVKYNSAYTVSAPYAAFVYEASDKITVDASVRQDNGSVRGVGFGTKIGELDVNNDGVISALEESVAVIDNARKNPVNYDYGFLSYSLGANYLLGANQSVYARYSRGGAAKADRAVFPTGSYLSMGNPKDMINQAELGWKRSFSNAILYVTGFYAATTEEGGFEATTQRVIENDYTAYGLEVEGAYRKGNFDLRGAATYTKASITTMNLDGSEGANFGNMPRRQPGLMYSIMPSYTFGKHMLGLSAIGQTKAYAQDNNELVMPGYMALNGFVSFNLGKGLDFGINGNNLLNAIGITESEEGSMVDGQVNYLRARSITGRSISASLRYRF